MEVVLDFSTGELTKDDFREHNDKFKRFGTPFLSFPYAFLLQQLEAESSSSAPTMVSSSNNTPAHREELTILASTGKSKEYVGVEQTHDSVRRMLEKDVKKKKTLQEVRSPYGLQKN